MEVTVLQYAAIAIGTNPDRYLNGPLQSCWTAAREQGMLLSDPERLRVGGEPTARYFAERVMGTRACGGAGTVRKCIGDPTGPSSG